MNPKTHAHRADRRSRTARARLKAFTLIELLTVIVIIGILAAIIMPVVGRVRENARNVQCVSNLRQVAMATILYAAENKNMMPAISESWPPPGGDYRITWLYKVWPYTGGDQTEVDQADIVITARSSVRRANVFVCPSVNNSKYATPVFGASSVNWNLFCYGLNNLAPGIYSGERVKLNALKSPSRTCMLSESSFVSGTGDAYRNYFGMLPHSDGANFAFYDGRVERRAKAAVPELSTDAGRTFWRGL